jgi:hypothetical protein
MIRENYPYLVILTLNMLDLKALSVLKRTHAMDPRIRYPLVDPLACRVRIMSRRFLWTSSPTLPYASGRHAL